jgi:hypothetical protein
MNSAERYDRELWTPDHVLTVDPTAPNLQPQTLTGIYMVIKGISHVRSFTTRDEARVTALHMAEVVYAMQQDADVLAHSVGIWLGDHPAHNNDREAVSTFEYGNDQDVKPEQVYPYR